jgi:lipopolysaccharide export system permease protein
MLTVASVVLVITVGWRFSSYLREAASGEVTKDILFLIIMYKMPGFLELILPLSFFLGIMLAYGRIYVDSEMVVLEACGMSPNQLLWITTSLAIVIMLLTAGTTFWLKPLGEQKLEQLFLGQSSLTEFDTLAPGRFQALSSGRRVTYTEELNKNGDLANVFINEIAEVGAPGAQETRTIVAASGSQVVDDETGNRFLVLKNGARYSGMPGQQDYRVIQYEEYGQLLARERATGRKRRIYAMDTMALWSDKTAVNMAELQWRLSIVLLVPILGLISVPLSRVNPRQGRFSRLVPGLALSFLYVALLSMMKSAIEKGQLPVTAGIWWVHALFLVAGLLLLKLNSSRRWRKWSLG